MKKIIPIFLIFLFVFSIFPYNLEAKTLKEHYDELYELEARERRTAEEKSATEAKIRQNKSQIEESQRKVGESRLEIDKARKQIEELNKKIELKKEEIKNLLRFKQVSSGENVYLEYVFGASDFKDFIYRSAIVEQLSKYNENLIQEMKDLIKENEKAMKELEIKIQEEEKAKAEYEKMLKSNQLSLADLAEEGEFLQIDSKAKREEIKYYESEGCKMDEEISSCVKMPITNGFNNPLPGRRPIYEDDMFGMRIHPIQNVWKMHYGVDIAAPTGTAVRASAAGKVANTAYGWNGGSGNYVAIHHRKNNKDYTTVYMHLSSIAVSVGDVVSPTTIIGYVGSTGNSNGPHLHFEIHYGQSTSPYTAFDPMFEVTFR